MRIRASRLCSFACLVVAVLGCTGAGAPEARGWGVRGTNSAPRQPDGVALEYSSALPTASERASAGGVVSLREPAGMEKVLDLVHELVLAWQKGAVDALAVLLTPDAGPLGARNKGRAGFVQGWRQRLQGPCRHSFPAGRYGARASWIASSDGTGTTLAPRAHRETWKILMPGVGLRCAFRSK